MDTNEVTNVIIALGIVYTPRIARLVRGSVLVVRELEYVQAARALGASVPRTMLRHVLPSSLSPLIVQATFVFAFSILGEAALSFLGVGVPPYIASWGNILAGGRQFVPQSDATVELRIREVDVQMRRHILDAELVIITLGLTEVFFQQHNGRAICAAPGYCGGGGTGTEFRCTEYPENFENIERVVCILTGHGLKDPDITIQSVPKPELVDADFAAVRRALGL